MNIKATDECSPTLHSLAVHHPQAEALSTPAAVRKVDTSGENKFAGQGSQDGASMHWRWRQAQAAEETFRNIAWICRDVSGKPNGTWIWDLQRTPRATSRASTTGLVVVQMMNMWAICWVGWVMQWQQAMRRKNLMLSLLLSAGSPEPLCLGKVIKEKNDQQWVSIYSGTASVIIWSTQVHGMRQDASESAERIEWYTHKTAFNFLY